MKYTMSMAFNKNHLKQMIMEDTKMTSRTKLHDIFYVDKDELQEKFPELHDLILDILTLKQDDGKETEANNNGTYAI